MFSFTLTSSLGSWISEISLDSVTFEKLSSMSLQAYTLLHVSRAGSILKSHHLFF